MSLSDDIASLKLGIHRLAVTIEEIALKRCAQGEIDICELTWFTPHYVPGDSIKLSGNHLPPSTPHLNMNEVMESPIANNCNATDSKCAYKMPDHELPIPTFILEMAQAAKFAQENEDITDVHQTFDTMSEPSLQVQENSVENLRNFSVAHQSFDGMTNPILSSNAHQLDPLATENDEEAIGHENEELKQNTSTGSPLVKVDMGEILSWSKKTYRYEGLIWNLMLGMKCPCKFVFDPGVFLPQLNRVEICQSNFFGLRYGWELHANCKTVYSSGKSFTTLVLCEALGPPYLQSTVFYSLCSALNQVLIISIQDNTICNATETMRVHSRELNYDRRKVTSVEITLGNMLIILASLLNACFSNTFLQEGYGTSRLKDERKAFFPNKVCINALVWVRECFHLIFKHVERIELPPETLGMKSFDLNALVWVFDETLHLSMFHLLNTDICMQFTMESLWLLWNLTLEDKGNFRGEEEKACSIYTWELLHLKVPWYNGSFGTKTEKGDFREDEGKVQTKSTWECQEIEMEFFYLRLASEKWTLFCLNGNNGVKIDWKHKYQRLKVVSRPYEKFVCMMKGKVKYTCSYWLEDTYLPFALAPMCHVFGIIFLSNTTIDILAFEHQIALACEHQIALVWCRHVTFYGRTILLERVVFDPGGDWYLMIRFIHSLPILTFTASCAFLLTHILCLTLEDKDYFVEVGNGYVHQVHYESVTILIFDPGGFKSWPKMMNGHEPYLSSCNYEDYQILLSLQFILYHGPTWHQLLGSNHWDGLLDPLNDELRHLIIRCGDLCQVTYDTFINDQNSSYCGSSRYAKSDLLEKTCFPGGPDRYEVVGFLYATARVSVHEAFLLKSLSRERWDRESNWIGFVAVSSDVASQEMGRREVYVAWRGTSRNYEWVDVLGAKLQSAKPLLSESQLDNDNGDDHRRHHHHHHHDDNSDEEDENDHHSSPKVMRGWLTIYTSDDPKSPFTKLSVRTQLLTKLEHLIKKYQHENLSITLTGHSLGATLSVLSAFDIVENLTSKSNTSIIIPVTAFVFGCPKVGNQPCLWLVPTKP